MVKIIVAPLSRFRNDQHLFLMTKTQLLIRQETASKLGIELLEAPLAEAVASETAAVAVEEGSSFTKKIKAKALERKELFEGFEHMLKTGLLHYDLSIREAAEKIMRVRENYGNIRMKTKAEKTTSIRNLTAELLNPENRPYMLLLLAIDWVTKLQSTNEEHDTLYVSRNKEEVESISGNVRAARQVTDPCYINIVERINAQVTLNGDANYLSFINQQNGIIQDLKTTLAVQKEKK